MRLTAAVLATVAVATTIAGIAVSASVDRAVRAEVAVAGSGPPLDVRSIRILDGLAPGESYRLPAVGIRNHRSSRASYRLVVSGAAQTERRPPPRWLRFVPAAVVIDAGHSRAVAVRLRLPADAEPGAYGVVLGLRPDRREGAHLTFRIEPAERTRAWLRGASLALWMVPASIGVVLFVLLVRRRKTVRGSTRSGSRTAR